MQCYECKKEISVKDYGAYRKLIDKAATESLCIPCLCKKLHITEEKMEELIKMWKEQGCALFV